MIMKGDHFITLDHSTIQRTEKENQLFGWSEYIDVDPLTDITFDMYQSSINTIVQKALKHYRPEQIILIESYPVTRSIDFKTGQHYDFPIRHLIESTKYYELFQKLFSLLKEYIGNCHVIEFPNRSTVLADKKHPLGESMFHFWQPQYEYVANAINIILNCPPYLEKDALNSLKQRYELNADHIMLRQYLNNKFNTLFVALNVTSKLLDINDFDTYLNTLNNYSSKYLIVFTVKDTPGNNLSDSTINKIKNLGFTNFNKQRRKMFIGVSYKSLIICNESAEQADEPIEYINEQLQLKACSNPYSHGNSTKIIIDDKDYAVNQRGINIVVYDTDNQTVIDSIAYDQHFGTNDKYTNKGFTRKKF